MAISRLELKQQAVEWLKTNRDKLIEEQTSRLFDLLRQQGKLIPPHRRRHILNILLHSLIIRLEGTSTHTEAIQEIVHQMISAGVNLPRMVTIIDSLRNAVNWWATKDWKMNPELREYLTDKVAYFSQLAKANAAALMVQAQSQLYASRWSLVSPIPVPEVSWPNPADL